jgi:serpin B
VITVDEAGTEAAAATGMAIAVSAPRLSEEPMVVDRPFLFWVAETATGAPLFLGTVTDPR